MTGLMKGVVSSELVRFVFVLLGLQAACAPALGYWLAHTSALAAYALSDKIWSLWMMGLIGSLLWSILFIRSHPTMVRWSLVAMLLSVLTGVWLPRL